MATLVRARELAEKLGISIDTVRAWARRGVIPMLRGSSRPMLFDVDAVIAALRERGQR